MKTLKLHYVMDPMCSWCWAFKPVWEALLPEIPDYVAVDYVMGGLAPDSDEVMPPEMQSYIQRIWRTVEEKTGAPFNHDFWTTQHPRRSTYPACRAVIAAGHQQPKSKAEMIAGIQKAYYLEARNPSNIETLAEVAESIGLDRKQFLQDFVSPEVQTEFENDLKTTHQFGVTGFPSLAIETYDGHGFIARGYCEKNELLDRWQKVVEVLEHAQNESST